jgi:hypothetical protein
LFAYFVFLIGPGNRFPSSVNLAANAAVHTEPPKHGTRFNSF